MSPLVTLDAGVLAPALLPALGLLVVLLGDAVLPRSLRGTRWPAPVAAVLLVVAAGVALAGALGPEPEPLRTLCLPAPDGACLWTAGPLQSTLQAAVLLASAAGLALLHDSATAPRDVVVSTSLVLATATGGVAVAAARDVGTWLVALELATVPLVALVALRGSRRAGHAGLTLLVTSLVSFALLVLGVALWSTATGDATFAPDTAAAAWADAQHRPVLVLAVTVLVAGLGFKLSLAPFHAWTPQAYSGADLGTVTVLAGASKVAALAALAVVVSALDGVGGTRVLLPLAVVAGASLLLGPVLALRQDDPTRLLAWSTVGQAGWVVLPLTAVTADGVRAGAAYVVVYATATVVALAVVARTGAHRLADHRGLLRRDPLAGGALALALLVLAGLPPGVVGLVVKVLALRPAVDAGLWPLLLLAVVAVVVGIAVYLRWLALLVAAPDAAEGPAPVARRSTTVVLVLGSAVLVVLSALPHGLLGALT